jgi:glutamyl-tRNA synthetase
MSVRVRYAPSPTGSPHVGNIRTAVFNWLFARRYGGRFIVRLEDTDRSPERYRPEYIQHIESSLQFLGIDPDEWWVSGGDFGPYVQSERLHLYQEAADRLIAQGHAYRCYCSEERLQQMREQQQARGLPSGYDRRCRHLSAEDRLRYESAGTPYTVRLAVPLEGKTTYRDLVYGEITFENKLIDDQVLLKSSGWPTYHLAVVVDDHAMSISHVIRGEDWQPSTPKQILLYEMLGYAQPEWVHVPLIVGPDRRKLSKRHGSTQFTDFVEQGYLADALLNFIVLLGWSAGEENREIFTRAELLERFGVEGITNHAAVFDYEKLKWMNGEYIRASSPEALARGILPHLQKAGMIADPPDEASLTLVERIVPLITDRMKLLSDAPGLCDFFFSAPAEAEEKARRKWLAGAEASERLAALGRCLALVEAWDTAGIESAVNAAAEQLGQGRGPLIHTTRVALTGRTVGPGLFELMEVLGREESLRRLETAMGWVTAEAAV